MTDEAMSPLRRRMIEDMTIRKLAPTLEGSIRAAAMLGSRPEPERQLTARLAISGMAASLAGRARAEA